MPLRRGPVPSAPARDLADAQYHLDHLRTEVVALTHDGIALVVPRARGVVADDLVSVAQRLLRIAAAVRESPVTSAVGYEPSDPQAHDR